jgi:4-amino-4-deoxy-L-arabinose transferase-like glycosyltransferase
MTRDIMPFTLPPSRPVLWWLYGAACASFLATLNLPYIGEEAVYTITSLEMRASGEYFVTTLYGTNYGRPPLLNWLVIAGAELLGWDRVLTASRIVTAGATVATGLVIAWLASRLTRNDTFAALAAVVFLTGDALFYRGWLAYADSLFTLLVFGAIACIWVSVHERRPLLTWLAVAALTAGFLAKVQTAYVFYGVALLALAWNADYRRELLRPGAIAAHAVAVAAFVAWQVMLTHGAQSSATLTDIVLKARSVDTGAYAAQLLWFPVETVLRFLPAAGVAIYYGWRARPGGRALWEPPIAGYAYPALVAMLAVNYAPYWLWPNSHIRYIMPLYPLIAILVAHAIWRAGERPAAIAVRWFVAAVALKYVAALWLYPAYHEKYRTDYAAVAADVLARAGSHSLYSNDTTATTLSVVAHVDQRRYPGALVQWPPREWRDGWLLARKPDPGLGKPVQEYALGRNVLYLQCRGAACDGSRQPPAASRREQNR